MFVRFWSIWLAVIVWIFFSCPLNLKMFQCVTRVWFYNYFVEQRCSLQDFRLKFPALLSLSGCVFHAPAHLTRLYFISHNNIRPRMNLFKLLTASFCHSCAFYISSTCCDRRCWRWCLCRCFRLHHFSSEPLRAIVFISDVEGRMVSKGHPFLV
jgi:hypothetical protein